MIPSIHQYLRKQLFTDFFGFFTVLGMGLNTSHAMKIGLRTAAQLVLVWSSTRTKYRLFRFWLGISSLNKLNYGINGDKQSREACSLCTKIMTEATTEMRYLFGLN
jgi:hypothetical protein